MDKYKDFQKSPYIKKHEKKMSNIIEHEKRLKNREYRLLINYKRFDKKKFILGVLDYHTEEELREFLTECVYCGKTEWLGLDRIDNSLGHTKENVLPCCRTCNTMRGDKNFTVDEMKKIGGLIKEIKENNTSTMKNDVIQF